MDLSPHFTLDELTASNSHPNIPNAASLGIVMALITTCELLEKVRAFLGNEPLHISSGYRSPKLNAAVGGVPDSAHLHGFAADFECPTFGTPLEICKALATSGLKWDQVIEEGTWVHISSDPRGREMILTKNPAGGYYEGLPK